MKEQSEIPEKVDKLFFNNPELWDKMETNIARFKRESKIILGIVGHAFPSQKVKLLDIGCGTGGHFQWFIEEGIECSGIDLNPKMIEYAKSKFPDLRLEVQDMKSLSYMNEFDVIICMNSTFLYNLTNDDILTTLHSFRNALKPNGLLIVDFSESMTFLLQRGREDPKLGITYDIQYSKVHAEVNVTVEFDPELQLSRGIRKYKFDDGSTHSETVTYRKLFAQEFKFFLEQTGFSDVKFQLLQEDRELTPVRLLTTARSRHQSVPS